MKNSKMQTAVVTSLSGSLDEDSVKLGGTSSCCSRCGPTCDIGRDILGSGVTV